MSTKAKATKQQVDQILALGEQASFQFGTTRPTLEQMSSLQAISWIAALEHDIDPRKTDLKALGASSGIPTLRARQAKQIVERIVLMRQLEL